MACIDLIRRTGAESIQIRYSDDEKPTVWMVVAAYKARKDRNSPTMTVHQVAAALSPDQAALRLAELLGDGGMCLHCKKPTGVSDTFDKMPLGSRVCWYQYDPELKKFRRGCE